MNERYTRVYNNPLALSPNLVEVLILDQDPIDNLQGTKILIMLILNLDQVDIES